MNRVIAVKNTLPAKNQISHQKNTSLDLLLLIMGRQSEANSGRLFNMVVTVRLPPF